MNRMVVIQLSENSSQFSLCRPGVHIQPSEGSVMLRLCMLSLGELSMHTSCCLYMLSILLFGFVMITSNQIMLPMYASK